MRPREFLQWLCGFGSSRLAARPRSPGSAAAPAHRQVYLRRARVEHLEDRTLLSIAYVNPDPPQTIGSEIVSDNPGDDLLRKAGRDVPVLNKTLDNAVAVGSNDRWPTRPIVASILRGVSSGGCGTYDQQGTFWQQAMAA